MAKDRDANGRFTKGHKLSVGNGGGRPKKSIEERYLRALSSRVSAADWKEIIDRAIADAKDGDYKARQWLSDYLIGKPVQSVDMAASGEVILKVIRVERKAESPS